MTTSATPAVPKRRLSQFYIEVPPSPVALSEYKPLSSYIINRSQRAHANLKENRLALPHKSDTPPLHMSLKRKSSLNAEVPPVKKIKQQQRKPTYAKDEENLSGTDTDGQPNGYIYCHQCLKKRDIMASIQCTAIIRHSSRKSDAKGTRCTVKFCKPCLMNRYGEDITQIKDGICHDVKAVGHADDSGYVFKCPKCRDICNCARCRKLKGLEPTGNLTNIARKAGASSAAHILRENPNVEGIMPGKGNQVKTKPATKDKGTNNLHSERRSASKHSSMTKIVAPIWKRLHIPLDLCATEDRIYIREFMLRFGKVVVPAISGNHLRELESIGGIPRGRDDPEDMPSWVSESCVKSMILGLLGFLVTECHNTEAIKSSMKDIRATGGNLNKLWDVLQRLRAALEQSVFHEQSMTFPDPLPPPASAIVHQTRSMRSANSGQRSVNIICSGQMVPVVVALINFALTTDLIREEIETGLKEAKEFSQKSKEAIKLENERWTNSRKTLGKERNHTPGQYKLLRGMHKQRLLNIDNSLEIISSNYVGRFQVLGKDHEGRTYWTTSPGIYEIVAAHEFLTTITSDMSSEESGSSKKKKKEQLGPETRPRDNSREWTWFVAVWGRAPPDWEASDSEDDEEDTRERWWVFDEAGEIRRLANWLGDGGQDGGQKGDRNTLPMRLIDFADLLEWRGRVDRYALL